MKRCPECGREYDVSLSFCLDDGAELLYGPASASDSESATAILRDTASPGEEQTRVFEPVATTASLSKRNSIIVGTIGIIVVAVLGIGSYWYFGRVSSKQIDSIAVMPFVNESGNVDLEYLSDGMTETLISSLTELPELAVKPRSSVFRYKGKDADAKTIGTELNVAAILNGTVVQRGTDMTLHVELVDTRNETLLWSADYKRPLANLVALQSEITRDVVDRLRIRLNSTDERKLAKTYTESGEAYQHYMQGRFYSIRCEMIRGL